MKEKLKKLIDDRKTPFAVNCTNEEEATELLKALADLGYCWNHNEPILDDAGNVMHTYLSSKTGESSYYFFDSFPLVYYGRKEFFRTINSEIIPFADFREGNLAFTAAADNKITYVEIFDRTAIENICSALAQTPDKIIFVGRNLREMEKACEIYKTILNRDGEDITFECRVCGDKLDDIVSVFSEIAVQESLCCFDITGGDDFYLLALGIVAERMKDKNIQIHRFDINHKKIYDCDNDGIMPFEKFPSLSVEEDIAIYGGRMASTSISDDAIIVNDINALWEVQKKFTGGEWNYVTAALGEFMSRFKERNPLQFRIPFDEIFSKGEVEEIAKHPMIAALKKQGIFRFVGTHKPFFTFEFKNEFIKQCLLKSGNLLELKIYHLIKSAKKSDGVTPLFNDVQTGVIMNWTECPDIGSATHNEIDVMFMDELIPVFVSCKNGKVTFDELYKLNTVAANFGGKYARKILVCTDSNAKNMPVFCMRARDMGIKIINNLREKTDEQLLDLLRDYNTI